MEESERLTEKEMIEMIICLLFKNKFNVIENLNIILSIYIGIGINVFKDSTEEVKKELVDLLCSAFDKMTEINTKNNEKMKNGKSIG